MATIIIKMKQTLFSIAFFTGILISCSTPQETTTKESKTITKEDSISNQTEEESVSEEVSDQTTTDTTELNILVQQVYKWHIENNSVDFPYQYDPSDSNIFTGIDWGLYDENIESIEATEFFSESFIKSHYVIADNLDASIQSANKEWRDIT